MRVVGTAGHVDHGKSTLVKVLTGINPDRLKEEQQREMTIELGFAWLTLPGGEEVGIVDVPGHRDFIENMLSGIGGIDSVIFVVAADEGVMPQTREHLAILNILRIPTGIVALTKTDLVDDPDWLDLVEEDLKEVLIGTVLENAPIVRVSARKRQGLDTLVSSLENSLQEAPLRRDTGRPRLAIDRVFTIAGFGTVVTGTLIDGVLHVGDEIELLPSGLRGRVRGLQTHKQKEEQALPGSRTAVNISGIDVDQVQRGDVVSKPGSYLRTSRMDVHFRLLPDASTTIRHNMVVKIFLGAAETTARIRLLGVEELLPGEEGWLQLELETPLVAVRSDHYILRRPSPGETLGGGEVVDPQPKRRHKRFSRDVLERLEKLLRGTPEDLLYQAAVQAGPAEVKTLAEKSRLSQADFNTALAQLLQEGQLVAVQADAGSQPDIVMTDRQFEQMEASLLQLLRQHHERNPLKVGIPREELKSRMKVPSRVFNILVQRWSAGGLVEETGGWIRLPGHRIQFNPEQQKKVDLLLRQFAESPFSPPSVKDSQQVVGEEVFEALLALEELVQIHQDVAFRTQDYRRLVASVTDQLKEAGTLTVAQFRDSYQTSRRYALAFMEHLDQIGVTVRVGDERKLKRKS